MTNTSKIEIETPSGKNEKTENFPVEKLIRADLRDHVMAFYHFARAADDISDNPLLEAGEKIARLDSFAAVLTGVSDTNIPCVAALRDSLQSTGVTAQHALDLLTAFKRDATQLRYKDWDDLMDYCRYSASPVGRHLLDLHGVGVHAWPANDALCSALQVINHLQDCADDYREMDRVYLPQDILDVHGSAVTDLSRPQATPALRATLNALLDHTQLLLDQARPFAKMIPDAHLKTDVGIIQANAEKLVSLLRKCDPLSENVKLGKLSKVCALCKGVLRAWL